MSQFEAASEAYAALGINVSDAIALASSVPISVHCWQADDVRGFEPRAAEVGSGGILATGGHPGAARSPQELRQDYERVFALCPGKHRANLHAMYADPQSGHPDRDELTPSDFTSWIDWARQREVGLDFNPTYFAHRLADSGATLSSADPGIRGFWIRHGIASRKIAQAMAAGVPCCDGFSVNNHWTPDGAKDSPCDRWSPRERLVSAYDEILAEPLPGCDDSVESKLFGIGTEDYVVGSFELCSSYALRRGVIPCLDMGHFHPTETIADKLSALMQFHQALLIHVSRPMRWDSDHVPILNDDLIAVFREIVRGGVLGRVRIALDFFDASINRLAAYVIGIRSTRKALLLALLEPIEALRELELEGRLGRKLALLEELKTLPFGTVWAELCQRSSVPQGQALLDELDRYEAHVLSTRGSEL